MAVEEAISIFVIGLMFWLVYVAFKIDTKNEDDELLPIQSMIVMILFASAGLVAYLSVQTMLGMAIANALDAQILAGLKGIHNFMTWSGFIILVLFIIGLLIFFVNFIMAIMERVLR
ncbi:MAG TPA: hypothetical protein ENI36_01475 [Thermoplasmatales archaeon]|nr:hypothetical protein [Thermoplasmatales archaeon]